MQKATGGLNLPPRHEASVLKASGIPCRCHGRSRGRTPDRTAGEAAGPGAAQRAPCCAAAAAAPRDAHAAAGAALAEAARAVHCCGQCGNLDSRDPCTICTDQRRDRSLVCVVEGVGDLWALERAGCTTGFTMCWAARSRRWRAPGRRTSTWLRCWPASSGRGNRGDPCARRHGGRRPPRTGWPSGWRRSGWR